MYRVLLLLVGVATNLAIISTTHRDSPWVGLLAGVMWSLLWLEMLRERSFTIQQRLTSLETNFDALAYQVRDAKDSRRQAKLQAAIDESENYGGPTCP